MANDGTLQFDTRIDQAGFDKGIAAMEKTVTSAGTIMRGILGSNLLQTGIEKVVEFGKQGIQLASDLEEVQNVVDVTFGEGAQQIEAFADSASASFGLTELQAKQFSGTIGAMVKSMGLTEKEALDMSTSLVGLAGDMASFYNLDHDTAFEKIRSGISGETEPLKQLGINMSVANLEAYALSKGIKRAYEDMSEAEKVQLRYGYIMQQTTDAQGDFVRTQDGYANQVRMLQNNLDTLAANVGALLVPALTTATGWVNDLFDGPETNETQAAIDGAIASLSTFDEDVLAIKNNYAKEAIKIQIDYASATGLLEDYEALKGISAETEGTSEEMAAIVEQLIALYPQLETYVDPETGLLAVETQQVRNLIDGYKDLSLYKLLAAKTEQIGGEFLDAAINMKLLEQETVNAEKELEKLAERSNEMKSAYASVQDVFSTLAPGENLDISKATEAANAYILSMGGLSDRIMEGVKWAGVDIDSIFANGQLMTAEEIAKVEGGIEALTELIQQMNLAGATEQLSLDDDIAAAENAVQTAKEAIVEYEPYFADALLDYQTSMDALNSFAEETGIDAGTALGKETANNLRAQKSQVESAAKYVIDAVKKAAEASSIYIPFYINRTGASGVTYPGHATGLEYVPYDNYLARLHVGEAVLSASEAQKWRNQGTEIDYEALAAALRDTNASEALARPIVLQIDGKTFAEAMAEKNLLAISARERRVSMGVGR